jgi:PKD repeat protein
MIRNLFLTCIALSFITLSYGQKVRQFDPTNAREGENVEYCHQHKKMAKLMQNPQFATAYEQDKIIFEKTKNKGVPKGIIYKIPIVFHVLHNNGFENISDDQIYNALEILNRDFRKQNADTATVQAIFQGMPSDVEIEFVLATKAPNGLCFKGITRTISPLTSDGADGDAQVTAIRTGNDVYQNNWPGNKYLNVFIVNDAGGAAGYTTNPSSWSASSMTNGIWILHDYVGAIGTSSEGASRALTHEVGHWLNLDHTWGPNNNPGNAASCGSDDAVSDTPNCIGVTSCNLNANTCDSDLADDIKDNVENYMDYSYCSKMYTAGQVARMRSALQVSSTGRFNLWQTSNLNSTGATGTLSLCKAQFTANRTSICAGEEIQFSDDSYNAVTGWSWEVIPSTGWNYASGSLATYQNPSIIFNQPGLYTIKLTATDGSTSQSETKTDYIRVAPISSTIPFWEGFENYTTLANLTNWEAVNLSNNNAWTIETAAANSGTKSAKLVNFGQATGNVDELVSAPIDLSVVPSTGSVTLSFRYAYRKKTTSDVEYLKVFVSGNCGDVWAQRKTLGGSQLSTLTSSTSWKPAQQSDWITVHMVNVTNQYFTSNFKMKFRFESDGGNNIYLDDINLYSGEPSDNILLGINDLNDITNVELYPNPTEGDVHIKFSANQAEKMVVQITDITGKVVSTSQIASKEGSNLIIVPTDGMSSGTYFVKLGNNAKALKFVVK